MSGDSADLENPFHPPQVGNAPSPRFRAAQDPRIAIADILFCMFAIGSSLMTEIQPWGGFELQQPVYFFSSILAGLTATVFYMANRRRRSLKLPFSSLAPGHAIAGVGAVFLATHLFQYFVSFLEIRHVGQPIHILAQLSQMIGLTAYSVFVLYHTRYAPRWQAYFITSIVYALAYGVATALDLAGDPSNLQDGFRVAANWLFRFAAGCWYLIIIFALVAYIIDLFGKERRDWLHHAGVLLDISACVALLFEESLLFQLLWLLNLWFSEALEWLRKYVFF